MTGRTVVLVSHAVGLVLPGAAFAVVLDAGNVVAAGTPSELQKEGHFAPEDIEDDGEDVAAHAAAKDQPQPVTVEALADPDHDAAEDKKAAAVAKTASPEQDARDDLIKAEKQAQGKVALSTYMLYFRSLGGMWFWLLIVVLFFGAQGAQVETNAWIRTWANASDRRVSTLAKRAVQALFATPGHVRAQSIPTYSNATATHVSYDTWFYRPAGMPVSETAWYLEVYIGINLLFALLVGARTVWLFQGALHASRTLYERLLRRILSAKMRWVERQSRPLLRSSARVAPVSSTARLRQSSLRSSPQRAD